MNKSNVGLVAAVLQACLPAIHVQWVLAEAELRELLRDRRIELILELIVHRFIVLVGFAVGGQPHHLLLFLPFEALLPNHLQRLLLGED